MKTVVAVITLVYVLLVLALVSCAHQEKQVVLRDAGTYRSELDFFQMSLQQGTVLLSQHLYEGNCACDDEGIWNAPLCEKTARHILIVRKRIPYHIWMMQYNAGLRSEPPSTLPEVGDPGELCPPKEVPQESHARI